MSDYVLTEDGLKYWPKCPIKGCQYRICLSLNSKYCFPHTGNGKDLKETINGVMQPYERKDGTKIRVALLADE